MTVPSMLSSSETFLVKGHNTILLERKFYQRDHVFRVFLGEQIYETEKNKLTFDGELD